MEKHGAFSSTETSSLPMKILIIEDDAAALDMFQAAFKHYYRQQANITLEIRVVRKLAELAAALVGFFPDVILSDNDIPGGQVVSRAAELRREAPTAVIWIISGRPIAIKPEGIDEVMMKPVSLTTVFAMLDGIKT